MVSIILSATAFGGAVWLMYSSKARARLADNQGKVVALFMIIVVVGVVLIFSSYNGILLAPLQVVGLFGFHSSECPFNRENCFYGIMFDAGSTGSRIHVYQFRPGSANEPYELMDELFKYNNKGLSTFAKVPKEGAFSLKSMLDEAKQYIPASQWSQTPIALKATAGLRLLDKEDAQNLLHEVLSLFRSYPFKLYENPVSIMEGTDEGVFSWYTLNFLKRAMGNKKKMMGVLDLGGGSTQITFVPLTEETKTAAPEGYITKIKQINGEQIDLYTHSYLGLGLMSGRFQMVGGLEDPNSNDEVNPDSFTSVCLCPKVTDTMKYNGKEYKISGQEPSSGSRYQSCYNMAKTFLPKYSVQKPKEIISVPFVTISYYYDRAVDSNLIDELNHECFGERSVFLQGTHVGDYCSKEEKEGGDITLADFINVAEKVCADPPKERPYLCLDLTYITALLREGFGMDRYTNIVLRKKISNIEITWGLGAIIELFNKYGIPKIQNTHGNLLKSGHPIHNQDIPLKRNDSSPGNSKYQPVNVSLDGKIANKMGIIVSDSMCAKMQPASNSNVVISAHPGYTISELMNVVTSINIKKYSCILVLVGTNDFASKSVYIASREKRRKGVPFSEIVLPKAEKPPVSKLVDDYKKLLDRILSINPQVHVLVSAILPRPFDYKQSNDYVKSVNKAFKDLCENREYCKYIDSYNQAMADNTVILSYFDDIDGLHFSDKGQKVLQNFFFAELQLCMPPLAV